MDEVIALVARLEAQWNTGDMQAMAPLWAAEAEPVYLAEEEQGFAVGWPAVRDYWTRTGALNQRVAIRYADVRAVPLGPAHALAFWTMHWDIALATYPKPLGGDNRVLAIARRGDDGWKFVAYAEAPLAPITYMRKLYESQVTPGF